jgi:hypothetical protein
VIVAVVPRARKYMYDFRRACSVLLPCLCESLPILPQGEEMGMGRRSVFEDGSEIGSVQGEIRFYRGKVFGDLEWVWESLHLGWKRELLTGQAWN